MPTPTYTPFSLTVLKDNLTQEAAPGAYVSVYGRGATCSVGGTINASNNGTIHVYAVGDIVVNSVVRVGVNGPDLTVTDISGTTLSVSNNGPYAVVVTADDDLILMTNRPTLYADSSGSSPLDYPDLTANVDGVVSCYVPLREFDYIVHGGPLVDARSLGYVKSGNVLSWTHVASGMNRAVLIGVAWSGTTEFTPSATYNGVSCTLLAQGSNTALFYLKDPATGSRSIAVTLHAGAAFAVGGAVSVTLLNQATPHGDTVTNAAGSPDTSASLTLEDTTLGGLIADVIGLVSAPSSVTLTPSNPQVGVWNIGSGTNPYARGAGSTRDSSDTDHTAVAWTAGSSVTWELIVVELTPDVPMRHRLQTHRIGVGVPSPDWINVRDYPTIQDAIDATGPSGGVVYVPAGTYVISSTINTPSDRPIHLLGDGIGITAIQCLDEDVDMLWIKGNGTTIEGMTLEGPNEAGGGRGIVIGRAADDQPPTDVMRSVTLRDCRVTNTASYCLFVLGKSDVADGANEYTISIEGLYERCEFYSEHSDISVRIGEGNVAQLFLDCRWPIFVGRALYCAGVDGLTCLECTFERNISGDNPAFCYVGLDACRNVLLSHCWFEQDADPVNDGDNYMLMIGLFHPCTSVTVRDCAFVRPVRELGETKRSNAIVVDPGLPEEQSPSVGILIENCLLFMGFAQDPEATTPDILLQDDGSERVSDVTIIGGAYVDSTTVTTHYPGDRTPLIVKGGAPEALTPVRRLSVLGNGPRVGLPNLSDSERDEILDEGHRIQGDTIYNTTNSEAQVFDGTNWIGLLTTSRVASIAVSIAGTVNANGKAIYSTGLDPSTTIPVGLWIEGTSDDPMYYLTMKLWADTANGVLKIVLGNPTGTNRTLASSTYAKLMYIGTG